MMAADNSAPSSTAGNISGVADEVSLATRWFICCSKVQLQAPAIGTPKATNAPVTDVPPAMACWPNIQAMPAPATAIATQVRRGKRCLRNSLANKAVSSGAIDIVISTVATVVNMIATMKFVYITVQNRPDAHNAQPPRRMSAHSLGPRMASKAIVNASALNALRQNVTSKLRAASR